MARKCCVGECVMRGSGIARRVERRPASLMRRLALIAGADVDLDRKTARGGREPGMGSFFGVGLLGGAAAGALAFIALNFAGLTPAFNLAPVVAAWTSLAMPISAPAVAASRPAIQHEPVVDSFDMTLQRAVGGSIPFQLRIVGPAEVVTGIVFRDLPAGVQLSRGERRDNSTWVVNIAELPYLHVALADGAPSTFDVRMDILARPDAAASSSIARVRVLDPPAAPRENAAPPSAAPTPAPSRVTTAAETPPATRAAAPQRPAARAERPQRPAPAPPVSALATPEPERHVQVDSDREARHWPEGASGLGALARASERQVWWKLPLPIWSPFPDIAAR